ncbi:hypothetical protein BJ912DRAFT_988351, partial [Pholiota molesta]
AKVFDDDDLARRRGCPRFIQGALSHFLYFTGACFMSCFSCATSPDWSCPQNKLPSTRARLRILILNDVCVGAGSFVRSGVRVKRKSWCHGTPSRKRQSILQVPLKTPRLFGLVSHTWELIDRCPGDRFQLRRRRYWSGPESGFSGVAILCFRRVGPEWSGGQRHSCGKVHLPTHKVIRS